MKITESTFRDILNDTKVPVVACFSATWCGPCKSFAPIFEMAGETAKKDPANPLVFIKLDVDDCEQLAEDLNIAAVPSVLVFENSQVVRSHQGGFKTEKDLLNFALGN